MFLTSFLFVCPLPPPANTSPPCALDCHSFISHNYQVPGRSNTSTFLLSNTPLTRHTLFSPHSSFLVTFSPLPGLRFDSCFFLFKFFGSPITCFLMFIFSYLKVLQPSSYLVSIYFSIFFFFFTFASFFPALFNM